MIINLTAAARIVPLTALMLTACVSIRRSEGASDKTWERAVRRLIAWKTQACKAAGIGVLLALAIFSYQAAAMPANASNTVQDFYDALLNTMKNGRVLGESGRRAQLEPVIRRTFDIPEMARLSVGASWATLTETQRQQVTENLARYIAAIYADRFESYAGQKLQVIGEQPAAPGIVVRSQIIKAGGEPVNVDYMMRRSGDSWLISDVYLDGTISEVATRRSEFTAIVKKEGVSGLIDALDRKAHALVAR
jgi:phospholipid transport system substrate-binding protein